MIESRRIKLQPLTYRKEIDGLRAFAVIPVILFHAGLGILDGGFVGVDIFFVISGFLITSIIMREMLSESFSLLIFYERRLRRILPVLFFIVFACIPFSWFLMPPEQFNKFSLAVGSIPLFLSNFLFWNEVDYFATSAELNPLLHTWSLAIEEQFYMLFPLLLLSIYKTTAKAKILIFSSILVVSLLYTEFAWRQFPAANFYLFPSRAWELLVGALTALLAQHASSTTSRQSNILAGVGLGMILFSYISLNDEMPFPSFYAVIPTFGTALVLLFATKDTVIKTILAMLPFVLIGRISYSLYLWHQPVFSFSRFYGLDPSNPTTLAYLSILLLILSYITWRFIENPFRNKNYINIKTLVTGTLAIAFVMIMFAAYGYFKGYERYNMLAEGNEFIKNYQGAKKAISLYREDCNFYYHNEIDASCLHGDDPELPITLIWGDSHAQALGLGLRHNFSNRHFFAQLATSSCLPNIIKNKPDDIPLYPENNKAFKSACMKANATALEFIHKEKVEAVIIELSQGYSAVKWKDIINYLEKNNVQKMYLVGPVPHWDPSLPHAYTSQFTNVASVDISTFLRKATLTENEYLHDLKLTSIKLEIIRLYPFDFLCRTDNVCDYIVPGAPADDRLMVFDYGHLSYSGSIYLTKKLFSKYFN